MTSRLAGLAGPLCALMIAAPAAAAPAPASEPEESGTRALSDAESYVRLAPLQTPVRSGMARRGAGGMLQVMMALDAPEAATRARISARRLWLRDAFNETLLLYASRIYRPGEVPDADLISELLQDDADRLLGEEAAQVLLDTVILHAG